MVYQGWRCLKSLGSHHKFLCQFCYHPRGKIDSLLFLENDITWQAPHRISKVVFSFWFWRLLEKRIIPKILGTCLDEIGHIVFPSSWFVVWLSAWKLGIDSCSLFPPHTQFFCQFKVRLVQMVWSWRDRRKSPDSKRGREWDCVPTCTEIPKSAGWFWFWHSSNEQLDILKSKLLSCRTFSIAAGPFLQSWRP